MSGGDAGGEGEGGVGEGGGGGAGGGGGGWGVGADVVKNCPASGTECTSIDHQVYGGSTAGHYKGAVIPLCF